jgi:hypothetical protein
VKPSSGFAELWASKEVEIEVNSHRAIYDFVKDDNYHDEKGRKTKRAGSYELLAGDGCEVKHDYLTCIYLSDGNVFIADRIWRNMDIVELYEKQAYKLVSKYDQPDWKKYDKNDME